MVDLEKARSQLEYLKKMNDTLEGQNEDLRSQLSQEKEAKAYAGKVHSNEVSDLRRQLERERQEREKLAKKRTEKNQTIIEKF